MSTLRLIFKGTFSLLAIVIGGSLICWVLYNEFVTRLPQYYRPRSAGTFGFAPIMIGVGLHWGRRVIQQLRAQQVVPADIDRQDRGHRG